jgi:Tfp pilus assembly protein PilO
MAQESLSLPYITLTGTVFLAIVVAFLVVLPQIEQWQVRQAAIDSVRAQLEERQLFLASIDQKSAQLRTQAAAEQELQVVLPAEESFDDVLRLIDRQAAAAGILIKSVTNETVSTQTANRVAQALGAETALPDELIVHGAMINWQGSYQQARQFVGLVENAVRFTDITDITLTQVDGQPDLLNGTFAITFYSLSAP